MHAVDDVSFNIQSGEVVGVVGESGCGKSTLGRMIAGIMPLTQGSIDLKINTMLVLLMKNTNRSFDRFKDFK